MKLTFTSSLAPDVVMEYLVDNEKFVRIHPIIYRMEPLSENTFLVYEKVKFGLIPYRFTYIALIEPNWASREVLIRATVKKMTHITMRFKVREINTGAMIEEEIEIKSPLPVMRYLQGLLRKQHALMFANMENEGASQVLQDLMKR